MMATKTIILKDINNRELIIQSRKSRVALFRNTNTDDSNDTFDFGTLDAFKAALMHLKDAAENTWSNLQPKEATSMESDYDEYYDTTLDNNGSIGFSKTGLIINRPYDPDHIANPIHLYMFNKRRMESFLYDLIKQDLIKCKTYDTKRSVSI